MLLLSRMEYVERKKSEEKQLKELLFFIKQQDQL